MQATDELRGQQPDPRSAEAAAHSDRAPQPHRIGPSSLATATLALLAVGYTLAIARPFLLPIAFAWLAKSALSPVVRFGPRLGIPRALTAGLLLLALTASVVYGVYQLSGPAAEWAERIPEFVRGIKAKLEAEGDALDKPIESVNNATEAVAELAGRNSGSAPLEVTVSSGRPFEHLLGGAWDLAANGLITLVLLYFMLATGDALMRKIVQMTPRLTDAKNAVITARAIESGIARYLLTITAINAGLGICVGVGCYVFGMPSPILWGTLAMVFNFAPYVGALAGIALVAAVGLSTDATIGTALAPAVLYAVLTAAEGMVITPVIIGHRLTLSPVLLFLWLLMMSWLWGIPGALVAVPLLAAAKITCDHLPRLQPIGRLLGA